MTPSISFNVGLWIWITVAVAGLTGAIALMVIVLRDNFVWQAIGTLFLMWCGATGLLTLGVNAAGWPPVASTLWRTLAVAGIALGPVILAIEVFKKRTPVAAPPGSTPPGPTPPSPIPKSALAVSILGTFLMIGDAILAFRTSTLTAAQSEAALKAGPEIAAASSPDVMAIVWLVALALLGLGAALFLVLFAKNMRLGGAPQIETHWGGIGGGLGGWRMSSSLSYLLVTGVLLLLFSIFFLQFDSRERAEKKEKPPAGATATPTPKASPTPTPKPSPTPDQKETTPSDKP
jgi:hypothetical protein